MCKQGLLLKEYPNKLLATLIQCLFGAMQTCLVAAVAERGHPSRWKLGLDFSLVAVAFSVRARARAVLLTESSAMFSRCSHVTRRRLQGIVGTGVLFYLQTWCVGMEGPVFVAMWNPLSLLVTVLCSSLLGETVCLGRQARPHSFIHLCFFFDFKIVTSACTSYLFFFQCLGWDSGGWGSLLRAPWQKQGGNTSGHDVRSTRAQ